MAWTDEMVDQLRAMWAEGLTTGEIGKRLGVSKNSIVGKVHRLGLSGRPSPIKRKNEDAPEPAVADKKNTTVKAKEKEKEEIKPQKNKIEKTHQEPEIKIDIKTMEKETTPSQKHPGKVLLTDLDNHTCRWPIGDPKDENFHFCGKKVRIGQTYCDEHANIAYVKPNKK